MSKPVKIMSIVWYKVLPAHFGGQKGIAHFNEALGKQFELYCVCSKNNEPGSAKHNQVFNWLPVSQSQVINPLVWLRLLYFAWRKKITHVILEHPYHAIAGWFLKLTGKKLITHSHNIEHLRFKNLQKKNWKKIYWLEKLAYKHSDLVLFKTKADLEQAADLFKLNTSKLMLVPYGVDEKVITGKQDARQTVLNRHNLPTDNKIILFNGTLDYEPNAEAVVNITKQLLPALRKVSTHPFTIIVTGRLKDPAYAYLQNIKARDYVFAGYVGDVEEYFLAADIYINPVNEGGGVQTKTIEALSYGLNVVTWEHMLNGVERSVTGGKVYTANNHNWPVFAQNIVSAMQNNSPTPTTFFQYYSWDANVQKLKARIDHSLR